MKSLTQIELAWHLWKSEISPNEISSKIGKHRATIYRWIVKFKRKGLKGTLRYYKSCKSHERKKRITQEDKLRICALRERYRDCCAQKIRYYLKKYYGNTISVSSIYNILHSKYKIKRRYKQIKYGEAPKGSKPREVIQTDTVDFGDIYAYTYIDTYTREAYVDLELDLESESGYASLTEAKKIYGEIDLLQNDGGPEFKGVFEKEVLKYARKHRVSRAYKKNEQSFIESFNRTLRKECLGWRKYNIKELPRVKEQVKEYLNFYNNERPHMGIGMQVPASRRFCRI